MDNTSNVVERLRAFKPYSLNDGEPFGPKVCTEAADTIERLCAELERISAINEDNHNKLSSWVNGAGPKIEALKAGLERLCDWVENEVGAELPFDARAMIAAAEGGE